MLEQYEDQLVAVKIMKNAIENNKISHAYLFETNSYIESKKIIYEFIKEILCINNTKYTKEALFRMIDEGNYPEIKEINAEGLWIKKEQVIDLQTEFSTKSILGNKKIYIINEADKLNPSSGNSILKFLEEPEDDIIAILIADNRYKVINTILSRCQIISFKNPIKNQQYKKEEYINYLKAINDFVNYYENNHIDTLLNIKKLWLDIFKSKEEMLIGMDLLMLYYKEIINFKSNLDIDVFSEYNNEINKLSSKLSFDEICKKIKIIIKQKEYIYSNLNSSLLMDKLIISFVKGE